MTDNNTANDVAIKDTIEIEGSEDVPEEDVDVTWVTIMDIKADKRMILGGEKLMDQHFNSA